MNYLAHVYLSYFHDDILIGNFAADFITNKQMKLLSEAQVNGVLLHRLIDAYTDIHPVVRKNTKLLRKVHGKYAPVVSDIIFDYILAKNWAQFHDDPLETYQQEIYKRLLGSIEQFPPKSQGKVKAMAEGGFIRSYMSLEGMHGVFQRMDMRTSFPSKFTEATEQLRVNEAEFTDNFLVFFPALKAKTDAFLDGLGLELNWSQEG